MTKYYGIIEHIKLGRDISSEYEADQCDNCNCVEVEIAYKCDCNCHTEIREQQMIILEAESEEDFIEKIDRHCTLQIIGDSDLIDSGLATDLSKKQQEQGLGVIWTNTDSFKSYD